MSKRKFGSAIDGDVMDALADFSKQQKRTKLAVVEAAIELMVRLPTQLQNMVFTRDWKAVDEWLANAARDAASRVIEQELNAASPKETPRVQGRKAGGTK